MTILPKKKSGKDKNESDSVEQLPHTSSTEGRTGRRSSPPRWLLQNSRAGTSRKEDRHTSHDPGGGYESPPHNKRRHRSSPHRNVRKHRHERPSTCSGHGGHRDGGSPSHGGSPSPTHSQLDDRIDDLSGYNSGDEYVASETTHTNENIDDIEKWFSKTLQEKRQYQIKLMGEDGACLFRAVADQVYGDQEMHSIVRQNCVEYMAKNADFFRPYVTEDYNAYLRRKQQDSCHGNHVEIQALSELYNRPIEVFQYSTEPINTFHGTYKTDNEPIRLSYHRNAHYNSVIHPYKATVGVGLGLPGYQPGLADKNLMSQAVQKSEEVEIEQTMLQDKMRETDWEVTQESIEEQVARESYLQWLRDNEKRAKRQSSPRSASATCSSATCDTKCWWDSSMSPEPRTSRSPRTRSNTNSAQNSPNRTETSAESGPLLLPHESSQQTDVSMKSSPERPSTSDACVRCPTPPGACGGTTPTPTTSSFMDHQPLGLSEWDEDDIIAQVIAQSQQEYLDNLKKNAMSSSSSSTSNAADTPSIASCTVTSGEACSSSGSGAMASDSPSASTSTMATATSSSSSCSSSSTTSMFSTHQPGGS